MTTTGAAGAPADPFLKFEEAPITIEGTAMTNTAQAADVRAAIENARGVYESVPAAGQVLDYLEAVMGVAAEARANAEWRERALKAEAALAGHVGAFNQPQTLMDACDAGGLMDGLKGFATEANAGAAAWATPATLAELSKEVFGMSNKLQQPADLTIQLLVLAELRAHTIHLSPSTSLFSSFASQ